MYPNVQLHINGEWRAARGGRVLEVLNPATEEVIGTVAHAGRDDLDEALAAAERGFATWRKVSAFDRYKLMRKAADIFRSRVLVRGKGSEVWGWGTAYGKPTGTKS